MRPKKLWILVTTLVVFLVTALLSQAAWSGATTQSSAPTQQRKLSRLVLPQEPIEIQEIKFRNGEVVSFSDKDSRTQKSHADIFTADEDWLAGLEGKFKNTYTKTITLIQIGLSVPSPNEPKHDIGQVFPFVRSKIQLAPGQEITLKFSENSYGALRDLLTRNGHATLVDAVLTIDLVVFDDGTAWRLGKFFRQDPNNTNRWILIGIKELLQEKRISLRKTSYKLSVAQKVMFANMMATAASHLEVASHKSFGGASQANAGVADQIKLSACLLAEGRNISLNSQALTRRPISYRWGR